MPSSFVQLLKVPDRALENIGIIPKLLLVDCLVIFQCREGRSISLTDSFAHLRRCGLNSVVAVADFDGVG